MTPNVFKAGVRLLVQRFFVESLTSALLSSWSSATGFTFSLPLPAHQCRTGQRKWPCWGNQGEFVWGQKYLVHSLLSVFVLHWGGKQVLNAVLI